MPLPDVELLARLWICVHLPVAAVWPLPLPGEIGIRGLAVRVRSLGRQNPPATPPDVTRHLMQSHADVGRDARIAVEGAIVIVMLPVEPLIGRQADIDTSEHLARRLITRDIRVR